MTRRVGAVDCGTNSIRLLVADVDDAGLLTDVVRRTEIVRLGQGIDRTGVISAEAMERTLAMSREYAAQCREHGVEAVRFVATSASRDARNADEFVAGVVRGVRRPRRRARGRRRRRRGAVCPSPGPRATCGGSACPGRTSSSTSAAAPPSWSAAPTTSRRARSIDIGCVRMTERHLAGDPPTDDEVVAARADVALALDDAERTVDLSGLGAVVGLAGSITTVTAHALGLGSYDRDAIHLAEVPLEEHRLACRSLLGMSHEERLRLPYMHPGRVDVIGAGALVWHEVLGRVALRSPGVRVVTSEHDILDGIALSVAD